MKHSGLESNEVRSLCQLLKKIWYDIKKLEPSVGGPFRDKLMKSLNRCAPLWRDLSIFAITEACNIHGAWPDISSQEDLLQDMQILGPKTWATSINIWFGSTSAKAIMSSYQFIDISWIFSPTPTARPKTLASNCTKTGAFSLHDSTSGTSETQRRPSAGLANSSCHRSFRILELQFFFSPF